jgi:hypothetical protein
MSHISFETWAVWSRPFLSPTTFYSVPISRSTIHIPKQTLPLTHITSFHTRTPHYIYTTLDVNMAYSPHHHASSSSLAMTTPSPPTRSGSESRLLDLPNSTTKSTLPKTRSPLSPSPYMDIVRVVSFLLSFLPPYFHYFNSST